MSRKKHVWEACKLLVLAACLALFSSRDAAADDPGIISLFGLSFDCADCEVRPGPPCRLVFRTPNQIVSCEEAAERLLREVLDKEKEPERPTAAELRHFLLSASQPPASAASAIKLLLLSEAGRRALTQDAYTFATKYEAVLADAVSGNPAEKDVWMKYWRLPATEGITFKSELRPRILAAVSSLGEEELYQDLTIVKPEEDLKSLAAYERQLRGVRQDLSQKIAAVRAYLESCQAAVIGGGAKPGCGRDALEKLSAPAQKFIDRVRIQWLIAAVDAKSLTLPEFVDRLSRIDFEKVRTPNVHETLTRALDAAKAGTLEEREKVTATDNWPMLTVFSKNDRVIAHRWAALLVQHGAELFEAGRADEAYKFFKNSFDTVPEAVDARAEILTKMIESKKWVDNPEVQDKFAQIIRSVIPQTPWYHLSKNKLVGIFAILCGLSFIWLIIAYTYKVKRQDELAAELTLLAEQEELAELREFFGIAPDGGEPELTKSYRRKAKETHPDVNKDSMEEFKDLQAKYQRARDLILGIRRNEYGEIIDPADGSRVEEEGEGDVDLDGEEDSADDDDDGDDDGNPGGNDKLPH